MDFPAQPAKPDIPLRSSPEADFDAKMVLLFQWARDDFFSFVDALATWLTENSTVIGGELNDTAMGQTTPAAGAFTTLSASVSATLAGLLVEKSASTVSVSISNADTGGGDPDALLELNAGNANGESTLEFSKGGASEARITALGGNLRFVHDIGDLELHPGGSSAMVLEAAGAVRVGAAASTARITVEEDANSPGIDVRMTHSSFNTRGFQIGVDRASSGVFNFMRCASNMAGSTDIEMKIAGDGNGTIDGSWTGGGADYAEYFEWLDGNPDDEDRRGVSVVLDGDKIRPAVAGEEPVGVTSANPSVIGDGDIDRWKGKYLRDDFGAYIWEDYEAVSWVETIAETVPKTEQATEEQEITREVIEVIDGNAVRRTVTETVQVPVFDDLPLIENGDPVLDGKGNQLIHRAPRIVEVQRQVFREEERSFAADQVPDGVAVPDDAVRTLEKRRKLNPDFDPDQEYIPRADRPEWDTVGLMGKLRLCKGQPVGSRWIKMRDVSADVEEWLVR